MYLTDLKFDRVKYDELVNINHADLLIFLAKIVFFLNAAQESAIADSSKLSDLGFLRNDNFYNIRPDIIKYTCLKTKIYY